MHEGKFVEYGGSLFIHIPGQGPMSQGFGKNDRITWFRRDTLNTRIDSFTQVAPIFR